MRHELADQSAAIIRERLAALTVKSFDELAALLNTSTEELLRDGTKMFVSVWHDVLESGEHRIAVQAGKRGWLASWRGGADGFAITSHNERRALTARELSPSRSIRQHTGRMRLPEVRDRSADRRGHRTVLSRLARTRPAALGSGRRHRASARRAERRPRLAHWLAWSPMAPAVREAAAAR